MRYFRWRDGSILDEPTTKKVLRLLHDPEIDFSHDFYEDNIKAAIASGLIVKVYEPLKESEFDNVCGFIADCLGIGE
jgi:hypothetical protein